MKSSKGEVGAEVAVRVQKLVTVAVEAGLDEHGL
jgi:hypothetical protein